MGGHGIDVGQDLPAPDAFLALGVDRHHRNARHVIEAEGIGRGRVTRRHDGEFGGDAEIIQRHLAQSGANGIIIHIDMRGAFEAGTDALFAALDFKRAGDDAAELAQALPAGAKVSSQVAPLWVEAVTQVSTSQV